MKILLVSLGIVTALAAAAEADQAAQVAAARQVILNVIGDQPLMDPKFLRLS